MSAVRKVLTIAGSDPSGGAGIQADLKTFSQLRVYGMSVIAALTAQNTSGVSGTMEIPAEFVARQLDAVFSDVPPDAVKTGMLLTAAVIGIVAEKMKEFTVANLVIDPVMMSSTGQVLMDPKAIGKLRRNLLPLALLVTPNAHETETLTGKPVVSVEDMEEAALKIHGMGPRNVLIKGGHVEGARATDVLFDGNEFARFESEWISSRHTHGTGCVLSAAITAHIASGKPVKEAVGDAKEFVAAAIRNGLDIGKGAGPCDPLGLRD